MSDSRDNQSDQGWDLKEFRKRLSQKREQQSEGKDLVGSAHDLAHHAEKQQIEALIHENKNKDLINQALEADNSNRKIAFLWVFGLVSLWMLAILYILTHNVEDGYGISDNVMITLLTTTTINIVGLPGIVLKYLFSKQEVNKSVGSVKESSN